MEDNFSTNVRTREWFGDDSLIAQLVKNPPAMQKTPVRFLGPEDPLEKGQAIHSSILGLPCGSAGKESICSVEDLYLIPGLGRSPGEGKGYPLQCSGLENSMDCPWGLKELDTTEQLSLSSTLHLLCTLFLLLLCQLHLRLSGIRSQGLGTPVLRNNLSRVGVLITITMMSVTGMYNMGYRLCKGFTLLISSDHSVQFSSDAQLCPTPFNPMDCSTPGFPVHHQLPQLAKTRPLSR